MRTHVVLLSRVLRLDDHPALAAAAEEADRVVPLFVFDDAILEAFGAPNRLAFLHDALDDLDAGLRRLGGRLVVRRGDTAAETVRLAREVGAEAVHTTEDASATARRRERALGAELELRLHPGTAVVEPGQVEPAGDHYRVYTPYWRRWSADPWRAPAAAPARLELPEGLDPGVRPRLHGDTSPELPRGGEEEGRRRAESWLDSGLGEYGERSDDLAGDATSRLSPYLHFGCVSPLRLALEARDAVGGEPFLRQLAWRDFYLQLLAANPGMPREDLAAREVEWRDDAEALAAWKAGRTGYPIVDAGMRQLAREGWMHNRARLVTASFLTKHLLVDWRLGAEHFFDLLVDGDLANNSGNWQWVAGTGVDTRPYRMFNPTRQAQRFDPEGEYVRRYVPELAAVEGKAVHEPWTLDGGLAPLDYPQPLVDHEEARQRFQGRFG